MLCMVHTALYDVIRDADYVNSLFIVIVIVFTMTFISLQPTDLLLPSSSEILEINSVISRVWDTGLNAHEKELIWRFRQVLQNDI